MSSIKILMDGNLANCLPGSSTNLFIGTIEVWMEVDPNLNKEWKSRKCGPGIQKNTLTFRRSPTAPGLLKAVASVIEVPSEDLVLIEGARVL